MSRATAAGEHRAELLRQMLLIRRFEEKCVELYSAAEIRGFVHLYIGEEAVAVGVNQALTPDTAGPPARGRARRRPGRPARHRA